MTWVAGHLTRGKAKLLSIPPSRLHTDSTTESHANHRALDFKRSTHLEIEPLRTPLQLIPISVSSLQTMSLLYAFIQRQHSRSHSSQLSIKPSYPIETPHPRHRHESIRLMLSQPPAFFVLTRSRSILLYSTNIIPSFRVTFFLFACMSLFLHVSALFSFPAISDTASALHERDFPCHQKANS